MESSTQLPKRRKPSLNRFVKPLLDAWKPWGARKYRYLLHSGINVVALHASAERATQWYPFQALRTIFFFPWVTVLTRLNSEGVWCVFRLMAVLKFCNSIVLRWLQSFLGSVIILEHHVLGIPAGTGSMRYVQHLHLAVTWQLLSRSKSLGWVCVRRQVGNHPRMKWRVVHLSWSATFGVCLCWMHCWQNNI